MSTQKYSSHFGLTNLKIKGGYFYLNYFLNGAQRGDTFFETPAWFYWNFEWHQINPSLTLKSKVDIFISINFQVAPNVGAILFEVTALDFLEFRRATNTSKLHLSCDFHNISPILLHSHLRNSGPKFSKSFRNLLPDFHNNHTLATGLTFVKQDFKYFLSRLYWFSIKRLKGVLILAPVPYLGNFYR